MNKYYKKLRAKIRRRKWRPKLLSPLPPFGKKFIKQINTTKLRSTLVSRRKRAKKLNKKGKSPSRLPSIRKRAPRFARVAKLSTPLHSTGNDLWIRFSESEIYPPVGSFYATIPKDEPSDYPNLKTFALSNRRDPSPQVSPSQDAPPQCPCSCNKLTIPDIPKVCLFDRIYEQPQSLQKKQQSCWQIYRASDTSKILPHEYDLRRRCKASHHWGRNIIESERMCKDHATCLIM